MKNITVFTITAILATILCYLLISFYFLSLNPTLWGDSGRLTFIFIALLAIMLSLLSQIDLDL